MNQLQNKSLALLATCFGFFMVIIDVNIVNVALPLIKSNLHGDVSSLQWIVDGYTLTFACFLLFSGIFSDRIGAKKIFVLGLLFFVITSIGCGFANNFWTLTTFRLLQGISGALLVPSSLALIHTLYDNVEERANAIGIWGAMGGVAAASGPILGALLASAFGWRAVFFINVPIGLLAYFLTQKYITVQLIQVNKKFDLLGLIVGMVSISALAFFLIEIGRDGLSQYVIFSLLIFIVSLILFIYIELKTSDPLIPLHFFKIKTFSASVTIGLLFNFGIYGELFILPLYFHQMKNFTVMQIGFALLPLMSLVAVACFYSGKLVGKTTAKLPMLIGLSTAALGFLYFCFIHETTPYIFLILPLMAIGFGTSFSMPAATIAAIHSVPANSAGMASGALNTSRQIGSLMGVAIFGSILASTPSFLLGMHITAMLGVAVFVFAFILTVLFIE